MDFISDPPTAKRRKALLLGAAAAAFAVIFALRLTLDAAPTSIGFLYSIPVALVAIELGARVGVANRDGRTTFVNPAAEEMLGWAEEELFGRPQHSIIHHSRPDGSAYPQDECPVCAAARNGSVHRVSDEYFWRKDGTSFPVEYVSTPVEDGGEVGGAA